MRNSSSSLIIFSATMVLAAIAVSFSSIFPGFCELPDVQKAIAGGGALNCFEFWLNRYQTLLGGGFALIGAGLAWLGIMRQTRVTSLPALRTEFEALAQIKALAIDVEVTLLGHNKMDSIHASLIDDNLGLFMSVEVVSSKAVQAGLDKCAELRKCIEKSVFSELLSILSRTLVAEAVALCVTMQAHIDLCRDLLQRENEDGALQQIAQDAIKSFFDRRLQYLNSNRDFRDALDERSRRVFDEITHLSAFLRRE